MPRDKEKEKEKRFARYWANPERIRERNRAYHYTRRGLPVPEKRTYKLRNKDEKLEKAAKELQEMRALLEEKEAALRFREEQVMKIEKSYTLKSYQPTYKAPSAKKKEQKPEPKPEPAVCFSVGGGNFV